MDMYAYSGGDITVTFRNMSLLVQDPLTRFAGDLVINLVNVNGENGECGYLVNTFGSVKNNIVKMNVDQDTNTDVYIPGVEVDYTIGGDAALDYIVTAPEDFNSDPTDGYTHASGVQTEGTSLKYQAGWASAGSSSVNVSTEFSNVGNEHQYVFVIDLSKSAFDTDSTGREKIDVMKAKLTEIVNKLLQDGSPAQLRFLAVSEINSPASDSGYFGADDKDGALAFISSLQPAFEVESSSIQDRLQEAINTARGSELTDAQTVTLISAAKGFNLSDTTGINFAIAGANSSEFMKSVNDSILSKNSKFTVSIPVNSMFNVDPSSVKATVGEAHYDSVGHQIIWVVDGLPGMTYKVSFTQTLKDATASGTYALTAGDVIAIDSSDNVYTLSNGNIALEYAAPQIILPGGIGYNPGVGIVNTTFVLPNSPAAAAAGVAGADGAGVGTGEVTIEDMANPLAANPLGDAATQTIADDETPMIGAPARGITNGQFALLLGIAGIAIVGAAIVLPKFGFSRKVKNMQ